MYYSAKINIKISHLCTKKPENFVIKNLNIPFNKLYHNHKLISVKYLNFKQITSKFKTCSTTHDIAKMTKHVGFYSSISNLHLKLILKKHLHIDEDDGYLYCDEMRVEDIRKSVPEKLFYLYSKNALTMNFEAYHQALAHIPSIIGI